MNIELISLTGKEITSCIPELAELRIQIFREYPYLYDGSLLYEKKYLTTYTQSGKAVIVVALHDGRVVGASTGIPLDEQTGNVVKPFRDAGYDTGRIFYFGESVLEKPYRGHGIGVRFFEEREKHAGKLGYTATTFCAVDRPADHPMRPPNYISLDEFWNNRGYTVRPDLRTTFRWQDIGERTESDKPMVFWTKGI
ncbi:MAG: GNAT family N-acetyltransferase [Cyclonatronaceae bacterium]